MTAADLLVRCLEAEGVEYIFGIPGEETLSLMDSLSRSRIRFILTRHEGGAAFMANVYGRLTGRPAVCLATLGPGATNLLTGVADAYLDRSPLVAITGQVSLSQVHKEAHQYINLVEIFRPATKWNARIESPGVIPEVVRKAFKLAQQEKPGATHLELPEDLAGMEAEGEPLFPTPISYPQPNPTAVKEASRLIEQASYPMVLSGHGVIRREASRELATLAHRLSLPVANTFMGMGTMDCRDELSLSTVGLHERDWVMCGLDRADVVLAVGYDPVEYEPRFWNRGRTKRLIHLDTTPAGVDAHYNPEVEMVSELKDGLLALAQTCSPRPEPAGQATLRRFISGELAQYWTDASFPVKPQRVIADLRRALGEEDILVSDVGAHKVWVARLFPAYRPNTVVISNGFASMGIAIPGAMAAKLAFPQRKVVAVVGDGGFMMTAAELETAKRLGLPFVVVVWADGGLGMIEWKQMKRYGRSFGVSFTNPDFVLLAQALGLPGFRVTRTEEFLPTLLQALELDRPSIIEVPVDYRENMRLTEKLGRLVCPI